TKPKKNTFSSFLPFLTGEIITDMSKKEWKLGLPIGQGGFGCIYLGKTLYMFVLPLLFP
uniref:Uncharacterized protein n=1 Tax=Spermophilus dauricus TaxID=99837 RepID=A0A8C9P1C7_SPEDA